MEGSGKNSQRNVKRSPGAAFTTRSFIIHAAKAHLKVQSQSHTDRAREEQDFFFLEGTADVFAHRLEVNGESRHGDVPWSITVGHFSEPIHS